MYVQCLSLHGGKDQVDRDHTLNEFKTGVKTVMVATSGNLTLSSELHINLLLCSVTPTTFTYTVHLMFCSYTYIDVLL